jgi:hypothetical protein
MEPRRAPYTSAPPLAALSYVSHTVSRRHSNIRSPSAVDMMNVLTAFTFTYSGEKKKLRIAQWTGQRSMQRRGGGVEKPGDIDTTNFVVSGLAVSFR